MIYEDDILCFWERCHLSTAELVSVSVWKLWKYYRIGEMVETQNLKARYSQQLFLFALDLSVWMWILWYFSCMYPVHAKQNIIHLKCEYITSDRKDKSKKLFEWMRLVLWAILCQRQAKRAGIELHWDKKQLHYMTGCAFFAALFKVLVVLK